jgi:hypothetical protein
VSAQAGEILDKHMSEAELQSNVIAHLKLFGWRYYHTRLSFGSNAGFPDLVAVRASDKERSRLAFIELKSEKGKYTDAQEDWLQELFDVSIQGAFGCGESTRCEGVRFDVYRWRPHDLSDGTIEEQLR